MPVIAFNASILVAEWYNDIKKGKRSKILNNRLERALRLENESISSSFKSYHQLELEIQELQDNIQKFQERLLQPDRNPGFILKVFQNVRNLQFFRR